MMNVRQIFEMFWKSADRIVQNTFIKSLVDVKAKDRSTTNEPENLRAFKFADL